MENKNDGGDNDDDENDNNDFASAARVGRVNVYAGLSPYMTIPLLIICTNDELPRRTSDMPAVNHRQRTTLRSHAH